MTRCLHPGGLQLTQTLLDWAKLPPGARVLDLGCGDGQTVRFLQDLGFDATGIDQQEPASERIIQGDMCALPFSDCSFDAVVAECSFSACRDAERAMIEARRVLKSQGHLLFSDVFFPKTDGAAAERLVAQIEQAGFFILQQADASPKAQEFFLRMIWETGKLPEEWQCIAGGRRAGYYLIYGRKNV